jgi:Holliday junction DNA helicase RuvA
MIALLKGILISKNTSYIILDVNGVGYRVFITQPTYHMLDEVGSDIDLYIHTAVREDSINLYGFLGDRDRQVFERLIGVSGIGPRQAINIMSGLSVDSLVHALCSGDILSLTSISGIGRKTAERLVLELKEKMLDMGDYQSTETLLAPEELGTLEGDVMEALVNLGYSRSEAKRALVKAIRKLGEKADIEKILRESIRIAAGA